VACFGDVPGPVVSCAGRGSLCGLGPEMVSFCYMLELSQFYCTRGGNRDSSAVQFWDRLFPLLELVPVLQREVTTIALLFSFETGYFPCWNSIDNFHVYMCIFQHYHFYQQVLFRTTNTVSLNLIVCCNLIST